MSTSQKPKLVPPKPKNLRFVRAEFAYTAQDSDELSFLEGDLLYIIDDKSDADWWKARSKGKEGLVPANFVNKIWDSFNPIHDACRRGNMDLLEECLLNRVPINCADHAGNTPLHCASHSGHVEVLQRLLTVPHIKTDLKNRLGDTPLHQASWKGHSQCVRLLREAGADFESKNEEDKKAIDLATDPETKAELKRWMLSRSKTMASTNNKQALGDYSQDDYASSDDEVDE